MPAAAAPTMRYRFVNTDLKTHQDVEFPNDQYATPGDMANAIKAQGRTIKIIDRKDEFENFVAEVYNARDVSYLLIKE